MKKRLKPRISIVIPTLNEEKYLPFLLNDLDKQTYKSFEVIVSDSRSTDKTLEIARKHKCRIVEGGKIPVGRNNGAYAALGDLILFLDSDIRLNRFALSRAVKEFDYRKLDIAVCDIELDSKNIFNKMVWEISNITIRLNQFNKRAIGSGQFILVKKAYFYISGGFDEDVIFAEDAEFITKCTKKRAKFRVLNDMVVETSDRRFKKEGTIKLISKSLFFAGYRNLIGPITKEMFKYEFGKFDEKKEWYIITNLRHIRENLKKTPEKLLKRRNIVLQLIDALRVKMK